MSPGSEKVVSTYYANPPYFVSIALRERMRLGRKDTHDTAYIALLDKLIARRKQLRMTQTDLAALMATEQSQISKFERKERRIDVVDYVRFCIALRLEPAQLLDGIRPLVENDLREKGASAPGTGPS